MAKSFNNIFVRGLSGSVGDQFVMRRTRSGKTIIANKPEFDENREFTETQIAQQKAFRDATTYAKFAKNDPVYAKKAKGTDATAYNVAVADWFNHPQVLDVALEGWEGQTGQTFRIKAVDDVLVTQVSVVILDANGTVLEEGEAAQLHQDLSWWTYTSTTNIPIEPFPVLKITAKDLPGHTDTVQWPD